VVQAVDLVDEEHVALVDVGEDRGEVPCPLDGRAAGGVDAHAELTRDDVCERGLAQPGRPVQQHVVGGLAARSRRLQQDREVLLDRDLADVLVEQPGTEAGLCRRLVQREWQRRDRPSALIHRARVYQSGTQ